MYQSLQKWPNIRNQRGANTRRLFKTRKNIMADIPKAFRVYQILVLYHAIAVHQVGIALN